MERLMLGLSTTAIGMLVVFCGLVILIACIYGLTSVTGRKKAPAPAPLHVPENPALHPAPEKGVGEDDAAVIAAITAAKAASWCAGCAASRAAPPAPAPPGTNRFSAGCDPYKTAFP